MAQSREINLIPYDVLVRERTLKRIWMWAGIILLVILAVSGFAVRENNKIGDVQDVVADLSLKNLEMEKKIRQLSILNEKRDSLTRKERIITTLLKKRSLSLILSEVERAMNDNMRLTSFEFKDGMSLSQTVEGKDSDMRADSSYRIVKQYSSKGELNSQDEAIKAVAMLHGIAGSNKDVARFLEQLSGSKLFSEVTLKYLREEMTNKKRVIEFKSEILMNNM